MSALRVLTILVRYGDTQYPRAEAEIDEIFARQLPGVAREVVVVDNALPAEHVERTPGRTLLGGDNRVREFTGFDRALAWIGPAIRDYDLVHIATSAFNTLYTSYLERFTLPVLRAIAAQPACIGHIDCYNEPVRLDSFVSRHWVRSCFFFLSPAQVAALGSFVSVLDGRPYFSGDADRPFRPSAPLSENYARYIIDWLTGADIGQGVVWHSRLALSPESLQNFEQKTLCIFNEHMLSIRLRAQGCQLVDVTWLSAHLATERKDVPWSLSWREQLARRDRDRL